MNKTEFFNTVANHYRITHDQLSSYNYREYIKEAARALAAQAEELFPDTHSRWIRVSDFRLADLARETCLEAMQKSQVVTGRRPRTHWTKARIEHLVRLAESGASGRIICHEMGLDYDRDMKAISARVGHLVNLGRLGYGRLGFPRKPVTGTIPDAPGTRRFDDRDEWGQYRRRPRRPTEGSVSV